MLETEKQLQEALNNMYQDYAKQLLHCLQSLRLASEELAVQFFQACSGKYAEGCCLDNIFGILQQLIDHIYTSHDEQMVSVERELKIDVQKLDSVNQTLSTQLKDMTLSANHLKATSDSLKGPVNCSVLTCFLFPHITLVGIASCLINLNLDSQLCFYSIVCLVV